MPQEMVEEELAELLNWHNSSTDLTNMKQVCNNAYQRYIKSRPAPSSESIKRVKEMHIGEAGVIPEYSNVSPKTMDLLSRMTNYRPQGTIFEIGAKASSTDYQVMKKKRSAHKESIMNFRRKSEELQAKKDAAAEGVSNAKKLPSCTADDINEAFSKVVLPKKRKLDDLYKPKKKKHVTRDEEFYIPYSAPDKHTEDGLAVNSFNTEAEKAQLELTADNEESQRLQTQIRRWDRKKKKMITVNNDRKVGKIRTESGVWIPATYKTNRYSAWKEKSKIDAANDDDSEEEPAEIRKLVTAPNTHWARYNQKLKDKAKAKARTELKRPEQILKARELLERRRQKHGRKGRKGQKKGRKH